MSDQLCNDPCTVKLEEDIKWIRDSFDNFRDYYAKDHNNLRKEMFDGFIKIDNHFDKLNGKVSNISKWRYMVAGGLMISDIIVLPIVLYLLQMHLK